MYAICINITRSTTREATWKTARQTTGNNTWLRWWINIDQPVPSEGVYTGLAAPDKAKS